MVIGIDTGQNGGIVGIEKSQIVYKSVMPFNNDEYDIQAIKDILFNLKPYTELVGVEKVSVMHKVKSMTNFKMGAGLYLIYGILGSLDIPYVTFTAKKWQDYVRINEDLCFKGFTAKLKQPKLDSKCTALNCAGRLFPDESFTATKRATKSHDGLVDAALIAYVTQESYLK